MTPKLVVALGLRLAALIWLLYTLSHMHALLLYLNDAPDISPNKSVVWVFASLQIATCAVLWFFPVTIATKLLPLAAAEAEQPAPPTLIEWQTLGVICIGLWGLSRAIPDAIYWLTYFSLTAGTELEFSVHNPEGRARLIMTIAEIAISTWLLLGARGFAAMLFKIRTAGIAKQENS